MSLVPYAAGDERSVILRHQQTLVLYDPTSHQIVLREASSSSSAQPVYPPQHPGACPLCHRPLQGEPRDVGPDSTQRHRAQTPIADTGFVDQNYFQTLHKVLEGPPAVEDGEADPAEQTAPQTPRGGINAAAFSPKYFEQFFVTERELGRGGKGVVLLVKHMLDGVSLGHFACKRVPVGDNHDWLKKVLVEVQLLQRLSHQNLVSYRHVWLEDVQLTTFGPSVPCAFILQQYCNSGDLHNYILNPVQPATSAKETLKDRLRRRSRGQPEPPQPLHRKLPFDTIISFFRDIASGLSHLHSNGFIHRDLKPSNCLLHEPVPGHGLRVLVSDFGEVQMVDAMRASTGTTGTISYCAPEVLRRAGPGGEEFGNFTTKSDVFSLGMILHFICFGSLPYRYADERCEENEDLDSLRDEITAWRGLDMDRRSGLPEKLYHSLRTLISPDPAVRPSAEEILLGIEMQGIGLDAFEDTAPQGHGLKKRRGSGGTPVREALPSDQLLGFRRISPVADTPPPATPVSSLHQNHNPYAPSHASSSTTTTAYPSKLAQNVSISSPLPPSPSSASPNGSSTNTPTTPTAGPIILRPKPTNAALGRLPRAAQALWARRLGAAAKMLLFLAKVASIVQPCAPISAPKPAVLYPLLALAACDLPASAAPGIRNSLVLLGIHLLAVWAARWWVGGLCAA